MARMFPSESLNQAAFAPSGKTKVRISTACIPCAGTLTDSGVEAPGREFRRWFCALGLGGVCLRLWLQQR